VGRKEGREKEGWKYSRMRWRRDTRKRRQAEVEKRGYGRE